MYAGANMGHPSREEGFVLCSNHSSANDKGERSVVERSAVYFSGLLSSALL